MKFNTTVFEVVRTYDIRFRYKQVIREGIAVTKTACTISAVRETVPRGPDRYYEVSFGHAVQDTRDDFDAVKGRKIALTKALSPFDKVARTAAWQVYHKETNTHTVNKKVTRMKLTAGDMIALMLRKRGISPNEAVVANIPTKNNGEYVEYDGTAHTFIVGILETAFDRLARARE